MDMRGATRNERNMRGVSQGLRWAAWFSLATLAADIALGLLGTDAPMLPLVCVPVACCVFLAGFIRGRPGRRAAAAGLDRVMASANRLESAAELDGTGHPLRDAQTRESLQALAGRRAPLRPLRVAIPLAALCVIWTAETAWRSRPAPPGPSEEMSWKAEDRRSSPPAEEKDEAELALTSPESEMRSKPMDEIAFEGVGDSTGGFAEISLKIFVNALPKKTVKVECDGVGRPGKLAFAGEFYLDELDVVPFDLVSYHLEGFTRRDKERRRPVVSVPQFIEVRPFREDAFLGVAAFPSELLQKQADILNEIIRLLREQTGLTKASFVAKSAAGRVDGGVLSRELSGLSDSQGALRADADAFIEGVDPKLIPANAYYSLKKAAGNMRDASEKLREAGAKSASRPTPSQAAGSPDLDAAVSEQQKAMANLIQAMRDVRKVIADGMGGSGEGGRDSDENPFKDKQEFQKPELKREDNPERRMERLRKEQEALLDKGGQEDGKGGRQDGKGGQDRVGRQGRVSEDLEKLSENERLKKEIRDSLDTAAKAGRTAEKALDSHDEETARAAGMKALANIDKALSETRKAGDKSAADAASGIRKDLNRASRSAGGDTPAQSAAKVLDAGKKAASEAQKQQDVGRFENAEKMSKASGAMRDGSAGIPKAGGPAKRAESMRKLERDVAGMLKDKDPSEGLREALDRMESLAREMRHMDKNRSSVTGSDARRVLEEAQLAAEDVEIYTRDVAGTASPSASDMFGRLDAALGGWSDKNPDFSRLAEAAALAAKVVAEGSAALSGSRERRSLNIFNPEDAPKEYRSAVGKYFERLSEGASERKRGR